MSKLGNPEKIVKIIGVIGENLGDEVLGISAYHYLEKKLENKNVSLEIAELIDGKAARNSCVNAFRVDRKSLCGIKNLIKDIFNSDVIIVGGGSLIQDKIGISLLRGTLPFILQIVFMSKLFRKKVISLPMGVDKLNTKLGKVYAWLCLRSIDVINVRDTQSKLNAISYSGLDASKINIVPDPAFIYAPENKSINKEKYAVISLAKENYNDELYWDSTVNLCRYLLDKGIHIKAISMDEKENEDNILNEKLKAELNDDRVDVLPVGNSVESVVNIIRSAELVVAMRLHAAIVAYGFTNTIMISRTTKTDAFIEEYGINGVSLVNRLGGLDLIDAYKKSLICPVLCDDNVYLRAEEGLNKISTEVLS